MKRTLTAVGKSLLIVTGVGYGVVKALDALADEALVKEAGASAPQPNVTEDTENRHAAEPPPATYAAVDDAIRRLDTLDESLFRIEKRLDDLAHPAPSRPERPVTHFVTHAELNALLEQYSTRFEEDIDRRFEVQDRSVQSLRIMIARTDELLEQVIENLESTRVPA